jgi:hypothetical protein
MNIGEIYALDLFFDFVDDNEETDQINVYINEHGSIDIDIGFLDKETARKVLYKVIDRVIDKGYYL